MKVIPYEHEEPEEKVTRIDVRRSAVGAYLVGVDIGGIGVAGGIILDLTPAGILLRECVNPDLGFPLDDKGRLKIIRGE